MDSIQTVDEFKQFVAGVEARDGYVQPAAFAIGWASVSQSAGGDTEKLLDADFEAVNFASNYGTAAVIADVLGTLNTGTYVLSRREVQDMLVRFDPFNNDGKVHANIDALIELQYHATTYAPHHTSVPIVAVVSSLEDAPVSVGDAYLRLWLLSSRVVQPHEINMDGLFGVLNNVIWTNHGPLDPEMYDDIRRRARRNGEHVHVYSVDKFPRMVDYVVPSGVRIADASRVRLGAYLGEGTTVMHEGFINFNAGTEGPNMVEGRISAGVWIGANTDIGGGASTMGTLSGGGKEIISVGKDCLVGAEGGIGIALGDNCTVEAGLYVTAGTPVTVIAPDGEETVKAGSLSGQSNLLFRRDGVTGRVEVHPNNAEWGGLNDVLHAN